MEFITINSKLTIKDSSIHQKYLVTWFSRGFYVSAFFFIWALNTFFEKIDVAREKGNSSGWVSVVIFGFLLLVYLVIACDFVFRRYWKSRLEISRITVIKLGQDETGLETNMILKLRSGRYKPLRFRTLENQFERFVEAICSVNPGVEVIRTESPHVPNIA